VANNDKSRRLRVVKETTTDLQVNEDVGGDFENVGLKAAKVNDKKKSSLAALGEGQE
jgi:hypothetical protein